MEHKRSSSPEWRETVGTHWVSLFGPAFFYFRYEHMFSCFLYILVAKTYFSVYIYIYVFFFKSLLSKENVIFFFLFI